MDNKAIVVIDGTKLNRSLYEAIPAQCAKRNVMSPVFKMKSIKIKKMNNNSSFVTNHDLLECLRNKSFVATRDNTSRLQTNKSKISLLEKKLMKMSGNSGRKFVQQLYEIGDGKSYFLV